MKKLRGLVVLLLSSTLLAGCVQEKAYESNYYKTPSGYVTTDRSDVTTGYNRDYQRQPSSGYYTSQTPPSSPTAPVTSKSVGYSSGYTTG